MAISDDFEIEFVERRIKINMDRGMDFCDFGLYLLIGPGEWQKWSYKDRLDLWDRLIWGDVEDVG